MSVLNILTMVFIGIVGLLSATGAFTTSNKIVGRDHKIPITINIPTSPLVGFIVLLLVGSILYKLLQ